METLRGVREWFLKNDVRIAEILDHGVSTGSYFHDPDGHMLEVYAQVIGSDGAIADLERNGGPALPTGL